MQDTAADEAAPLPPQAELPLTAPFKGWGRLTDSPRLSRHLSSKRKFPQILWTRTSHNC